MTHEVLEMVPLDLVGKVANIDTAVLLRVLTDVARHGFFGSGTLFVGTGWWRGAIAVVRAAVRVAVAVAVDGGAVAIRTPTVAVVGRARSAAVVAVPALVAAGTLLSHVVSILSFGINARQRCCCDCVVRLRKLSLPLLPSGLRGGGLCSVNSAGVPFSS